MRVNSARVAPMLPSLAVRPPCTRTACCGLQCPIGSEGALPAGHLAILLTRLYFWYPRADVGAPNKRMQLCGVGLMQVAGLLLHICQAPLQPALPHLQSLASIAN
jgi:hypothetical protein